MNKKKLLSLYTTISQQMVSHKENVMGPVIGMIITMVIPPVASGYNDRTGYFPQAQHMNILSASQQHD